jgi:hypothetical protein
MRAFGLLLDRRNARRWLDDLILNDAARLALQAFRESPRFPFAILAGELHLEHGGFLGGFADSWASALRLFATTTDRIGEEAGKRGLRICSGWVLLVNERRVAEVRSLIAQCQVVEGHA